ncbi:MAG TPA: GNAT family N-acetyltransferase [Burkholderiaceae bacterium]|nr:GNAT family N-acetyltransferase [Burkholderiaceae bacterium]
MTANLPWPRSERLRLREFVADDLDDLVAMHREPRLRALLIDDYPLHLTQVSRVFLERMTAIYRQHEGLGIWHTSVLRPEPLFAGWFNLMPMAERPGEVEIGGRLLPAMWGGGLAQEGGELMLDHALELGLPHVWGICHPGNRSAIAVLAAMGFESLGVLPYDGQQALHHRIDLNAWRELRNTPRAIRLRRALRSLATARS